MASNKNFMWLEEDIRDTLVLKVMYANDKKQELYGVFEVMDVLETTGDELEVKTANIDDLTNLLALGIVRFVNVSDTSDIMDIPLRKLYMLYRNANVLGEVGENKTVSFEELEVFSIIDGTVRNDMLVLSAVINEISDDLNKVLKIASEFGNYGMQEKFDALSEITLINHRRLVSEAKEKKLK